MYTIKPLVWSDKYDNNCRWRADSGLDYFEVEFVGEKWWAKERENRYRDFNHYIGHTARDFKTREEAMAQCDAWHVENVARLLEPVETWKLTENCSVNFGR